MEESWVCSLTVIGSIPGRDTITKCECFLLLRSLRVYKMASDGDHVDDHEVDDHMLELMKQVISQTNDRIENDSVARALLFFLVRVANTWRSIRTLQNNTPDEDGFTVDAGTLLRAMFDAYIQAEYIVHDPCKADGRARDYLDFEHVERFKSVTSVVKHDTPLSNHLKASPKRPEGEKRLQQEYDRVKARYFVEKRRSDGTVKLGPGTRNTWYARSLSEIARTVGKEVEYDTLLKNFHGCVHSSPMAVGRGPMVSAKHVLDWASTIVARVARLNIEHNRIELDDLYGRILDVLCKPYF